jgi:CRISPR-associated protein Cas2
MERNFYILAYDIGDDRRRQKIAKLCEANADRVQGSVFEGYFTPAELEKLLKRVMKTLDEKEDSLRVYLLCASCKDRTRMFGRGRLTPEPAVRII